MNREMMYWKFAWDTFHLQIFDYGGDVKGINNWIQERNLGVRNVLEIGCGAGHYLKFFRGLGYNCTGIDFDRDILEYARQLVLQKETDVELMEGDILREIPSKLEGKFDLVLAKHLSFPLNGLEKVLCYVKKALAPGGPRLLVFDFLKKGEGDLEETVLSIDSAVRNSLFLVRLNQMKLIEELNEYRWSEVYIVRDAQSGFTVTRESRRSLWFISRHELEKLLQDNGIGVEVELEESVGIDNLSGVTIYGKLSK